MHLRPGAIAAAIAATLALTPAAAAQTNAPPGNSGVEQYLEAVPDAAGGKVPERERESVLPDDVRRDLERAGPDGEAVSRLVDRSAPDEVASRLGREDRPRQDRTDTDEDRTQRSSGSDTRSRSRPDRERSSTGPDEARDAAAAPSPRGAIPNAARALASDDGMGIGLPIVMVVSVLAAAAVMIFRHRSA